MFYTKNLPGWERAFRVVMGIGLLVASILHFGPSAIGWATGLVGVMAAMSGLVGFCPGCAMAGRKLNS